MKCWTQWLGWDERYRSREGIRPEFDKACLWSDESRGGRPMRTVLELPFTCRRCHHAFFVAKAELDKNEPIHCPKCSAVFRLKSEQMKNLAPGRRPVRD
jgi:DNA-directed RNA polymerase subunit RPC12/RpoP